MNRTALNTTAQRPLIARFDQLGIAATTLCVVHCLTLPLIAPLLVASNLAIFASPIAEKAMLITTLLLAATVFAHSCQAYHRHLGPLLMALVGAGLYMCKGHFGHALEPAMVAVGGSCIIAAHLANLRLCRHCKSDKSAAKNR